MSLRTQGTTRLLVAMLLVSLLTSCNRYDRNQVREVNVSLLSFNIAVSPEVVGAGDVTFHLKNDSTDAVHEFAIVRTSLSASRLPIEPDGSVEAYVLDIIADLGHLDPGQSGDFSINLNAGKYVVICNIGGHYKKGMYASLTVAP